MDKRLLRLAVVAALVPALGGCALLGIGRHEPRVAALSTLPMGADAFIRFEEGRAALDTGQNAAAIAAFSQARLEPTLLGPSLNGMGVAWARLGRPDQAARYFRLAVAAAPEDRRFAANLELAQGSLLATRQQLAAPQRAVAEAAPPARTVLAGRGPVQLVTRDPAGPHITVARPQQRLARIDPVQVELSSTLSDPPQGRAQVRVQLAEAPRGERTYPVRVALAD